MLVREAKFILDLSQEIVKEGKRTGSAQTGW
jgi:hypothetical protein